MSSLPESPFFFFFFWALMSTSRQSQTTRSRRQWWTATRLHKEKSRHAQEGEGSKTGPTAYMWETRTWESNKECEGTT